MMKKFLQKIKRSAIIKAAYKLLFIFAGMLPKKRHVVIFESFLGKQYSCNPRAIYEYLQKKYPKYECYWSIDPRYSKNFEGFQLKVLNRFSLKWLYLMARSKYWVSNSRLPIWIPKPKKTTYLQTWHGTPLKKLGIDIDEVHMPGTKTEKYKKNFQNESSRWDYLVSPNPYSSSIFPRAFGFNGTLIESGYPRNDFLLNHTTQDIETIRNKIGIPDNKKVLLYAPTWRDDEYHSVGKYKFLLQLDLEKMKKQIGEEWVIVLRLHYLVADRLDISSYGDFIIDASNHTDIRELYVIADMLMTDYSSVFFDYAILQRPILFFVYDLQKYKDKLRGFYFDFESQAPGPLLKSTDEVLEHINKNKDDLLDGFDSNFSQQFISLEDGQASRRVVDQIFK
ncbi:CDP-glycerol glycerophosphotransferase family protein [Bacillus shivajii]|uniref:CDP-glycerol glycerophosphotransferase family protein n=1 Tax=Bacillus shivajii TaxID=1983719 RepID=UPI001CFAD97A|nr:CDP-glycerol glycerophosphotransferase family protein [Bacillus shivajii]UCZ52715.1 CDP-glycerol glycerophosphotransferase family protein [Bacillus shivajii]